MMNGGWRTFGLDFSALVEGKEGGKERVVVLLGHWKWDEENEERRRY